MNALLLLRSFLRLSGGHGSQVVDLALRLIALAKQQEEEENQSSRRYYGPHAEGGHTGDEPADLIDDHGDDVGKAAHIPDLSLIHI